MCGSATTDDLELTCLLSLVCLLHWWVPRSLLSLLHCNEIVGLKQMRRTLTPGLKPMTILVRSWNLLGIQFSDGTKIFFKFFFIASEIFDFSWQTHFFRPSTKRIFFFVPNFWFVLNPDLKVALKVWLKSFAPFYGGCGTVSDVDGLLSTLHTRPGFEPRSRESDLKATFLGGLFNHLIES